MKKTLSAIICIMLALTVLFAFVACQPEPDPTPEHTHQYESKVTKEATCTEDGVKTFTCDCKDSYEQKITATGHTMVDGVCSACGHTEQAESYTIYFKNDSSWEKVSVYVWLTSGESTTEYEGAWPGAAMTKVDDLWYSYTVELPATEGVKLIFNNGLAEGAAQTGDLNFSTEKLWWANSTAYATKAEAENVQTQSVTVYYRNTEGWEAPHAHAWNTAGNVTTWPGVAMTKVDGTDDWYSATFVTASLEGLGYLFCDGVAEGGEQTDDVIYNENKLYYAGGNSFATKAEAEANQGVQYADLYLKGSFDSWGAGYRFVLNSDGSATLTVELAKDVEFKIASSDWTTTVIVYDNGNAFGTNSNFDWGNDYCIKVVNAATYTFTVDAEGNVTITKG